MAKSPPMSSGNCRWPSRCRGWLNSSQPVRWRRAIHDAYGKALGENSYNLLGSEFVNSDLSTYLTEEFAGEYLDQYTSRQPKAAMPIYHLVGALDPLFRRRHC